MLFGICTLIMDIFKTGYYSSFFECQSAIKILHPVIQAVFVIIQVSVAVWKKGANTWPLERTQQGVGDLSSTCLVS